MRSVIIAYSNDNFASQLKRVLVESSISIHAMCANGSSVLHIAGTLPEAVVICPIILPDMPANHLAEMLPASFDVLALSKVPANFNRSFNLQVMTLPLKQNDFVFEVSKLCSSSTYVAPSRKEKPSDHALLIGRAKAIIMAQKGISEDLAHKHLQHISMTHGKKIVETAREIIKSE